MHTYSLFNILVIFELLETFLIVFLSFPLFLFVLVVSMAPKRKSTLAWNSLRSGTSSSSDSAPLSLWFHDDDAHKVFLENFSRRDWESLCDVLVTCPLVLIQEFYSNMHRIDCSVPLFFTLVRGTCIPVTPQLVADVLRVPRIEFPDYPSCERLQTMSKDELMAAFCEHPSD